MQFIRRWIQSLLEVFNSPHVETNDPPPCPHCGRCVLAGPACCSGMAADIRAYESTPKHLAWKQQQRKEGAAAKATRKAAKRQRSLDKRAARGYPINCDAQDRARVDASAWEGMIDRRE